MEPTESPKSPVSEKLVWVVEWFEHAIAVILVVLLMIVVVLVTAELVRLLVKDLTLAGGGLLLEGEKMFELFGSFLLVLVGTELLTSLKAYLHRGVVHMEVVLEVALIALAQKIIILNPRSDTLTQFGLAALLLALAGSFWAVRAARRRHGPAK
jgi:uncharacterized membrane protein (DUF373 family)